MVNSESGMNNYQRANKRLLLNSKKTNGERRKIFCRTKVLRYATVQLNRRFSKSRFFNMKRNELILFDAAKSEIKNKSRASVDYE